jgi:ribose transport system ATP-binding protein
VTTPRQPLLSVRAISKRFPGVQALRNVGLEVDAGEVVGLVGENGAGKSTLIKILGGIHRPDEGEILIDGDPAEILTVRDSMSLGISLIHQELNLAENLSIAENIFLGKQPYRGPSWLQITHRSVMYDRARELLRRVGLDMSPRTQVQGLSVGQRQLVEVAKALSIDARVLVFDEPTSSLSLTESRRLLELIKNLRDQGVAILYVSHRLGEVIELCDRTVVLRDGGFAGVLEKAAMETGRIVSLMVGRDIEKFYHHTDRSLSEDLALEVEDFVIPGATVPASFTIRRGEIVGFAGLVGAGRTELARALFGVDPALSGAVKIQGRPFRPGNPRRAIKAGLMLVPENRKEEGLVLEESVAANVSMAALPTLGKAGLYNRTGVQSLASEFVETLSIRTPALRQKVLNLSGGNQQKVVLAKWLAMKPGVLILDEPTRGVDVGAKSEIYELLFELVEKGVGVMMISSEMEEVIALSDRVVVMHARTISGELAGDDITEENIMKLAIGSTL